MLFALALLFTATFASGCQEPVAGSPVALFDPVEGCNLAMEQFGSCLVDLGDYTAQPAGTMLYDSCPCSCPDGANSQDSGDAPEMCAACSDEATAAQTCVQTCVANGGDSMTAETCMGTDCVTQYGTYTSCVALYCASDDDDDDDDDAWMQALEDCAACESKVTDYENCAIQLAADCMSPCLQDETSDACVNCIPDDACMSEVNKAMECAYDNGCMDATLETCAACSSEEGDMIMCMMDSGCDTEDEDFACWNANCGDEFNGMYGCKYTNCVDASTYDVWFTQSFCGDGTNCDSDCSLMMAEGVSFGTCTQDDDGSSWMAACNTADNTVTYTEYATADCSGASQEEVMTNAMCDNMDDDPVTADYVYKYEWFGNCGGEEYVAPSSTSTLFVVVAFILSVILY